MQTSYLFYDLETSGLNKCFDQVLQFAAIRTDEQFNEIDRQQIFVRLNPDMVLAPGALITHRIALTTLQQGEPEFAALQAIHQQLNQPGTISLGYNSLGFDDEFLRFSFYRNLLTPYTHQYANNCKRMDIYPMMVMYYLYKPEVLAWPKIQGKISMRLEAINQVNQLAEGAAHDAMVDVEVTLALARKLRQQTQMWDYLSGFFDKPSDMQRQTDLSKTPLGKQGLLIQPSLGARVNYQVPVLALGQHKHYKNQSLWLHLDKAELADSRVDDFIETTWVTQKKAAEPGFLLPWKPRFLQHMSSERQALVAQNKHWLQQHPQILTAIKNYYSDYTYPDVPRLDVDAALYAQGFWRDDEQRWMRQFQTATWSKRVALLDKVASARLYDLAVRVIGRYDDSLLSESHAQVFAEYLQHAQSIDDDRPVDYRGQPRLTPTEALSDIDTLLSTDDLDQQQQSLLQALLLYVQAM